MGKRVWMMALLAGIVVVLTVTGASAAEKRILFLSTSETFPHGPIVQTDGKPSVADEALAKLAKELGATFTTTKDASQINAENLKNYDLVIFYTQGDLTKPNKEGAPVIGPNGGADLIAWVKNGGGFMGFHSATDSFRGEGVTPYIGMIGAEFRGHGGQFVGTVQVVDPTHPVMAHVPNNWAINEEWYLFDKFNTGAMRVLALLEPGNERTVQESYNIPAYPIIWVRTMEKGRVYYSALGHREDIWTNPDVQKAVTDAIRWTWGEGEAKADPNFDAVVPKTKPGETPTAESAPKEKKAKRESRQ